MKKSSAKELIVKFTELYKEKIGVDYPPSWGRDGTIFKRLLAEYSQDTLVSCLELYFSTQKRIYAIPFFKCDLPILLQELKHEEESKPQQIDDNESWRFAC